MAFQTQFALTLELSRLIPLQLFGNAAQSALVAFARELRNSNSDIVIEEDLAELFGRSRVAPQLESSFRAVVSRGTNTVLTNEIVLVGGPGPTVTRGLRERPYFSTIVQLSLLAWVHNNNALARGLVEVIEKRLENAPSGYRAPPGQQGVSGTLKACEEQTSAYSWSGHLHAVGAMLGGYIQNRTREGILVDILCGLLDMLPMVQTLPDDRMIHIEGENGVTATVVWAHHVLGLTVLVKTPQGKEVRFGKGHEQVYIDSTKRFSSISLFDCSGESKDKLFFIQPDTYQQPIESYFAMPLMGYGKTRLKEEFRFGDLEAATIQDLTAVIIAIAFIINSKLASHNGRCRIDCIRRTSERRIIEAARIFFDEASLDERTARPFVMAYRDQPLDASSLKPPLSVEMVMRKQSSNIFGTWRVSLSIAKSFAMILVALAHVEDIALCQGLRIGSITQIHNQNLVEQLQGWNGQAALVVQEGTWFELLASLFVGYTSVPELDQLSLVSEHGWSIYVNSFSELDPASLTPGVVKITHGVPYRNGVRKNGVIDGPCSLGLATSIEKFTVENGSISPRNSFTVTRGKPLFSERGDNFAINLRFVTTTESDTPEDVESEHRRTGYRELHRALWQSLLTTNCPHSTKESFTLSPGCIAVSGFPEMPYSRPEERIVILLTVNSVCARWRALLGVANLESGGPSKKDDNILLRTNDCCLRCAVTQAAQRDGNWIVIA
jgi:hypothetical protein